MEPNSHPPPFWPSPPMRRRRSSSPPFVSLPVLIILLPTLVLILLFFAIRPLLSLTNQVFRPSSVTKSWGSFNVFLVLFAIICGIFARRNDDEPTAADVGESCGFARGMVDAAGVEVNGDSEISQQGFGFSERRFSDPARRMPGTAAATTRLRRNSSYPDLRQESSWENGNYGNQFRFFDDFEVNKFRSRSFAYRTGGSEIEESPAEIKVIPVDSFVVNSSPAPNRMKSPNPQLPPPLLVTQRKSGRTYQAIQKRKEVRDVSMNNAEFTKSQSPPPPLPPLTVIPPSPVRVRLEEEFRESERKKTNVKKEIAIALSSLYRKRKTKQKAKDIHDGDRRSPTDQRPPPPPPPPPPPSFFRIFKKPSKNKKVQSESAPLPPPPPVSLSSRSTKKKIQITPPPSPPPPPSSRQQNSTASLRPPLPGRVHNSFVENQILNSGIQNPTETMPPSFKTTTDVKSGVRGDTVGSQSSETSHCGSPKPENVDSSSITVTPEPASEVHGVGGVGPVFCPSPDVNIKAANFIARLRGEWRLEKMNWGPGPNYEITSGHGPND